MLARAQGASCGQQPDPEEEGGVQLDRRPLKAVKRCLRMRLAQHVSAMVHWQLAHSPPSYGASSSLGAHPPSLAALLFFEIEEDLPARR